MTTGPSTSLTRRLAAALIALLLAMPALAVIAQPASAHRQTTQRCDYDPISGTSFNCRQVPVSHTHPKPKPEPTCPAGTTGTPPDCSPIPSDNTNHNGDQGDGTDESDGSDDSDSGDSGAEESSSEEETEEESGSDPQVPNHYSPPPDTSPRPDPENDESESDEEAAESEEPDGEEGDEEAAESEEPDGEEGDEEAAESEEPDGEEGDDDETGDAAEDDDPACPTLLGTHPHLDREQHNHGSFDCHDASVGHQHTDGSTHTDSPPSDDDRSNWQVFREEIVDSEGVQFIVAAGCLWITKGKGARAGAVCGGTAMTGEWTARIESGEEIDPDELLRDVTIEAGCSYLSIDGNGQSGAAMLCDGVKKTHDWIVDGIEKAIDAVLNPSTPDPDRSQPTSSRVPESALNEGDGDDDEGTPDPEPTDSGRPAPPTQGDSNVADPEDSGTETVPPVQTPDTTTHTEPVDSDSGDQQGGGDSGAVNSETDPPPTTEPPVAVGPVTGFDGAADGNSVWLGWNVPATGPAPTAYRVLRSASGGTEQEVARVGGNAYFDSNVQSGVTYTYRIQAISGTLAGPVSASVSVTIR